MTLIAEDLLLLLTDDETGKIAASSYLGTALGGAVLVELALDGVVEVREGEGFFARAKVHVTDAGREAVVEDPVLARAREQIAEKERTAQDLVGRLGKGVKDELLNRLETRGILQRREDKVLGLFPRTSWPAADSGHEDQIRQRLTGILGTGLSADERSSALISLLYAVDQAHRALPVDGLPGREIKKRAKQVAEGEWAAKAVRDAVQAAQAAVTTAIAAGGAAAAASSS